MARVVSSNQVTSIDYYFAFLLSGSFIFGFIAGTYVASQNAELYATLIECAVTSPISAIGLFSQIVLPLALTALIFCTKRRYLAFVLCFLQAFSFGIEAAAVYFVFGSARWLISPLLLFTRTVLQISLFWLWLRSIPKRHYAGFRDIVVAFCASTLAAVLDMNLISPFISSLFS